MEGALIRIFLMAGVFCTAVLFSGNVAVYAAETPKLVNYKIVDESSIPLSLTGKKGNSDKGRKLVINRKKGNCLACHTMPIPEQPYHGKVGPDLNGVASRYEEGELRLLIVNPKIVNETTMMPAFYKNSGFNRVHKKFKGKTILSAQEVEDIVAYITTLK